MEHNMIRALSQNGGVVFCGLDSTAMVREAERIHKTSAVASAALGRLLTAASMMGMMLKTETASVTLRLSGGGPAGTVLAVAGGDGWARGYVQNPVVELPLRPDGKLNVGGAVGCKGTLSVVRDDGLGGEPYVGQVPLASGEVAEDVTAYYAVSEQVPTVCALGVLVNPDLSIACAGGYLIQLLPGATEAEISQIEQNISSMPSVTALLSQGKTPEEIMQLAMAGFDPQMLDGRTVGYRCDCSLARVERALASLGRAKLEEMAAQQEEAEVTCQFCDKIYHVPLKKLLAQLD